MYCNYILYILLLYKIKSLYLISLQIYANNILSIFVKIYEKTSNVKSKNSKIYKVLFYQGVPIEKKSQEYNNPFSRNFQPLSPLEFSIYQYK